MTFKLPPHLFTTSDGMLHDTRETAWATRALRPIYERHYTNIKTAHHLKASVRAGATTDLGGYPLYFVTADSDVLSFDAVRRDIAVQCHAVRHGYRWRIVACEVNYEDDGLYCAHTGERIPSAYAEPEDDIDMSLTTNGGVINPDKENPL